MKGLILIQVLLLLTLYSSGQKNLSGYVKDENGIAVTGANVLLKNSKGLIAKFTVTDNKGYYRIALAEIADSNVMFIALKHFSYEEVAIPVVKDKDVYDFTVKKRVKELEEVVVKVKPIMNNGDTTSYRVASFAKEEDRSIADVIRRMPGLDVDENGQISFNGKTISNLYTHGDDLMDGRYGSAIKVITKDMIQSVDVIQHHQPVKVLQNVKSTDDVALNLVLKDENSWKLSGQGMIGLGLPKLYTANLNTVLLNRKLKTLNTLKVNNAGEDYRAELARMGSMLQDDIITSGGYMLSSATVGNPDLPKRNYYFNKSGLANINLLIKNKQDVQFRTNIQAFADRQQMDYYAATIQYTSGDTIRYNETQQIRREPLILNGALTIMANTSRYFINNRLVAELETDRDRNALLTQQLSVAQRLNNRSYIIGNTFSYIPALKGGGIMDLSWSMQYRRSPQRLSIDDGLHSEVLNGGTAYEGLKQQILIPAFTNNIKLGYLYNKGRIRQQYTATVVQESKQLRSSLHLLQNEGGWEQYTGDAGNNLIWNRYSGTITAGYSWSKPGRYEIGVSLPLTAQYIRYRQAAYGGVKQTDYFWFNPSFSYKLFVSSEEFLALSYGLKNTVADMGSVYGGLILTNYRSLQSNDAPLQERKGHTAALRYSFQRSIQMLFLNTGISYKHDKVNTLLSLDLADNIQKTILLPLPNTVQTWSFNAGGSKYVYKLKSTLSLNSVYTITLSQQLLNEALIPVQFNSLSGRLGFESRIRKRVNVNYNALTSFNTMKQKAKDVRATNMYRIDQQLNLGFNLFSSWFFQVQGRNIHSGNREGDKVDYWFADLKLRYTIKRLKTDVELDVTNIANVEKYELMRVAAEMTSLSTYHIRGRMALLKFTFNL